MKKLILTLVLSITSLLIFGQKDKENIINYFASNNQIIGVPMVDMNNTFRFYPDVAFHDAISSVKVYYFVINDVFKSHLVKREEGRYWECKLRDFELGESIQRVEVNVECDTAKLIQILKQIGLNKNSVNDYTLYDYLLLRRGSDQSIAKEIAIAKLKIDLENTIKRSLSKNNDSLKNLLNELNENKTLKNLNDLTIQNNLFDSIMDTEFIELEFENNNDPDTITFKINKKEILHFKKDSLKHNFDTVTNEIIKEFQESFKKKIAILKDKSFQFNSRADGSDITTEKIEDIILKLNELKDKIDLITKYEIPTIPDISFDETETLVKNVNEDQTLYNAFVENRRSSMLDLRYKNGNDKKVEFT